MTLQIEILPGQANPDTIAYITRMLQNIQNEIDGVNGIVIRNNIPERPRKGTIYYLTEDIDDITVEGYYVWTDEQWKKLAYE